MSFSLLESGQEIEDVNQMALDAAKGNYCWSTVNERHVWHFVEVRWNKLNRTRTPIAKRLSLVLSNSKSLKGPLTCVKVRSNLVNNSVQGCTFGFIDLSIKYEILIWLVKCILWNWWWWWGHWSTIRPTCQWSLCLETHRSLKCRRRCYRHAKF